MEQHLRTNIGGCFPPKSEEIQEVKKAIKDMIYVNKKDEDAFNNAVDNYKRLIRKGALSYAWENYQPKKRKENKKEDEAGENNTTEADKKLEESELCDGNFDNSPSTRSQERNPMMELAEKKECKMMDYFNG